MLGRTVSSNTNLQTVDKALSDPQAVIQNLAGDTGQNCFAYKGDCINLNDNNAIAAACGAHFTAVGWDDAGCGKKNCVSLHAFDLPAVLLSTSDSNRISSIAENLFAAQIIKRHKIASGEVKAQEAVCLQTATDNVLWGRLISKVSAHPGVVAS